MRPTASAALAAFAVVSNCALAYPEGAPWGAARPDAEESCASCHYDFEPILDSAALSIDGLPEAAVPGKIYTLIIRLTASDAAVAGFQLLATSSGKSGSFRSLDGAIEVIGPASRSVAPVVAREAATWRLLWQAPERGNDDVLMYLAISAANDDQSPLGDVVHYRQWEIAVSNP